MAINKLPTIAEYWRVDNLIGNDGIQNTMIRNRFCEILQNLHFADNRKDDKTDKAFKIKPVIDHPNSKFSEVLSNDSEQSINEHMVKFKGRSGMKQYIKSKPMKWGFKFWSCCQSKSGYLYQMDIYVGRKQTPELNIGLGEEVVFHLMKDLEQSFYAVYFDDFFNNPKLMEKLFQKGIYGIRTVPANRKQIPKVISNKQTKRGNSEFLFQVIQWFENEWIIGHCCFYHLPLKE